jgi:hypothetical protein
LDAFRHVLALFTFVFALGLTQLLTFNASIN